MRKRITEKLTVFLCCLCIGISALPAFSFASPPKDSPAPAAKPSLEQAHVNTEISNGISSIDTKSAKDKFAVIPHSPYTVKFDFKDISTKNLSDRKSMTFHVPKGFDIGAQKETDVEFDGSVHDRLESNAVFDAEKREVSIHINHPEKINTETVDFSVEFQGKPDLDYGHFNLSDSKAIRFNEQPKEPLKPAKPAKIADKVIDSLVTFQNTQVKKAAKTLAGLIKSPKTFKSTSRRGLLSPLLKENAFLKRQWTSVLKANAPPCKSFC